MRNRCYMVLAGLLALIAGCEGVITGTEVVRVPLQAGADGSYAPVKFSLGPEMNPVAINLRADYSQNPQEFGKWNSYRATLTLDGKLFASRNFNLNHPVSSSNPDASASPPSSAIQTLWIVDLQSQGDYELSITPLKPAVVTLNNPQIDVRRNVQRPPQ